MKDKYYIPTIDEFHVGFECESNYVVIRGANSKLSEYKHFIFTEDNISYLIEAYINDASSSEVRVKYLDREDIESLGWTYYKTHSGTTTNEFELGEYTLTFDSDFSDKWNLTIDFENGFNLFHGSIKNKSELSKLMKQLNIVK